MGNKVDRQISVVGTAVGAAKIISIGTLVETAIWTGTEIALSTLGVKSSAVRTVIGGILGVAVTADVVTPMIDNVLSNAGDSDLDLYQRINPNIFKKVDY